MSEAQVDQAVDTVAEWQDKLGLGAWEIVVGETWPTENEEDDAFVYRHPTERQAIIYIHPKAPTRQVPRLVVHELLHLMHITLDEIVLPGQSISVMELYDTELERLINTLSTALTDTAWEPITPVWRERFEYPKEPLE